jgi:hypothetical protein
MTARGGRQGGGFGSAAGHVFLTNDAPGACFLNGNPTVMLVSDGIRLDVTLGAPNPATPELLLAPGGSAILIVYWSNWCGQPPGPLDVEVTLAGGAGELTGPFNEPAYVPDCNDSMRPSTLNVVEAYIPGF